MQNSIEEEEKKVEEMAKVIASIKTHNLRYKL
jgi:hypothetical protein